MSTENQQPSNEGSIGSNSGFDSPQQSFNDSKHISNDDLTGDQPQASRQIGPYDSIEELYDFDGKEEEIVEDQEEEEGVIIDDWLSSDTYTDDAINDDFDDDDFDYDDVTSDDFDNDDESEIYDDDEPDVLEEEEEPIVEDGKINVDDLMGRLGDAKNLQRTGEYAFNKLDKFKARLSAKLDGEMHMSEFLADKEMKEILIGNFKAVCKEFHIEIPPAVAIFVGSLAIYSAPLVVLLLKKYGEQYLLPLIKKVSPKAGTNTTTSTTASKVEEQPVDAHPYAHTKEYKCKRRAFQRHASTGAYKYTSDGKRTLTVDVADEFPHEEIAEILDDWKGQNGINKRMKELLNVQ